RAAPSSATGSPRGTRAPRGGDPPARARTRSPSARPREPEHALGDDVAEDLARAGLDRVSARAELLVLPGPLGVAAAVGQLRARAEDLEGQLRQPLVRLRPHELRRRALRTGDPGLLERRQ